MAFKALYRAALAAAVWSAAAALAPAEEPSLAEMAGQMTMVGFEGNTVEAPGFREALAGLESGEIGGVIFFGHNVKDRSSLIAMTSALAACACKHPPFLAVDEEGGLVERLTAANGFHSQPSARATGALANEADLKAAMEAIAAEVADAGFNFNLAPVVDLEVNPANAVIARLKRSYGREAQTVYRAARAFVMAHRARGVLTALKHFPGHGSSNGDTHTGVADVSETWSAAELVPYQLLILDGLADSVMAGHISNSAWQGPATLAPANAITGLLRGRLGFDGVVVSDDLDMGAVRDNSPDFAKTMARAVEAGNDVLIYGNQVAVRVHIGRNIHAAILTAAQQDVRIAARVRVAFGRILALKAKIRR